MAYTGFDIDRLFFFLSESKEDKKRLGTSEIII